MFIDPIQVANNISDISQINKVNDNKKTVNGTAGVSDAGAAQGAQVPFKSVFEDAVKDVISTDQQVNADAQKLATGQSDNLHQYSIDIAKAQLSIDLLVELRNKALDSYNEIMRMSI
ncbi:flagellar hook-basal body complex protein FliE [Aminipila terrae]|uniref:Flagellar hook-basal body complex protein FliE n=1 Tax=Aminipila terrae TaxID=2697030 RepID=A0A6P1MBB0_9FIRM|nr:flagellar hook-basal body complex protein FliE [Aminipila terrae]QHI71979.1 flagellar hook-basal body complex protein FliE [Aminipila terrae]